jgi:site-specific DNA-methyltransferase (adenine-specific)
MGKPDGGKINREALFSAKRNDWETPQYLFDELDAEFHFTLDPCADAETAKCSKFYTEEDNGLSQDWTGEVVFCNPPYTNAEQTKWVKKCSDHGKSGGVAVMLIPARTDTKRFHDYIYNKVEVRFIRGRLKFGDSKNSAPFPSMIVVFGGDKPNE